MPGQPEPAPRATSYQGTALGDWLEAHMFDRRIVWIRGRLDDLTATAVATQLMTLDGSGDDPIQLHINSAEGTLSGALTLMDTIAALGVRVEAVCAGRAEGPALGVLAVSHRRQAASHSRLRLHDDGLATSGAARGVAQVVAQHQRQLEHFVEMVGQATQQPAERIEIDLAASRYFDVEEALQYHLVDAIWRETSP
ncbi:MAG TPA: ATP-dependent Clp protease proteolytic subunit, partial [Candidatus Dormibacteraeota bacterium]